MPNRRFSIPLSILAAGAAALSAAAAESVINEVVKGYYDEMQKSCGIDARQLVNDLHTGQDPDRARPKKPHPYRKAEMPASFPGLPDWKFDVESFQRRLMAQTALDKEGNRRLKTEEYEKSPTDDNLEALNPTIRWLNFEEEKFATEQLDAVKSYTRCDDVIALLLWQREAEWDKKLGRSSAGHWLEGKCWQVAPEFFFTVVLDHSGAWKVRSYTFWIRHNGKLLEVAEFESFPDAEEARLAYGVSRLVPEALNNFAILKAENVGDPDEIVALLEVAGERLPLARHNLYLYYLNQGRVEEARKVRTAIPAKDRLPAPEPAVK